MTHIILFFIVFLIHKRQAKKIRNIIFVLKLHCLFLPALFFITLFLFLNTIKTCFIFLKLLHNVYLKSRKMLKLISETFLKITFKVLYRLPMRLCRYFKKKTKTSLCQQLSAMWEGEKGLVEEGKSVYTSTGRLQYSLKDVEMLLTKLSLFFFFLRTTPSGKKV